MRRDLLANSAALLALLAFAGVGHFAHGAASAAFSPSSLEAETPKLNLPSADAVRVLSVGQRTTASDLYFLKMVQYIGTPAAERVGWPQLHALAELVTDLDPEYGYPYEVAGVLLSMVRRFDESNRIFAKGIEAVPDRWQLPFFGAYNYWFELDDYPAGAELLWRASKIPGCPPYASQLAARLASKTDALEEALAFVEGTLRSDGLSDKVRERMEKRRLDILVEMDLKGLEAAIERYRDERGILPGSLADLVGPLEPLPAAPDGSSYEYDVVTGEVRSPLLPVRLRFVPPSKPK